MNADIVKERDPVCSVRIIVLQYEEWLYNDRKNSFLLLQLHPIIGNECAGDMAQGVPGSRKQVTFTAWADIRGVCQVNAQVPRRPVFTYHLFQPCPGIVPLAGEIHLSGPPT